MTNREILATIKATMNDNADVVAYVDREIAKLDHKNEYNSARRAKVNAEKSVANAELEEVVYNALAEIGEPIKVSDLVAKAETLADYSYPKITPRLKALVECGRVVAEKKGKTTLYSIA